MSVPSVITDTRRAPGTVSSEALKRGLPFEGLILNRDPRFVSVEGQREASERLLSLLSKNEGSTEELTALIKGLSARDEGERLRFDELEHKLKNEARGELVLSLPDLGRAASELEGLAQLAALVTR